MSEWVLTEEQMGLAIHAAYKRGFEWAEDNGFNRPYLNKAASDYTDKAIVSLCGEGTSTSQAISQTRSEERARIAEFLMKSAGSDTEMRSYARYWSDEILNQE